MKKTFSLFVILLLFSCQASKRSTTIGMELETHSPTKKTTLLVGVKKDGTPYYTVKYNGVLVINESKLGFKTQEGDLSTGFALQSASSNTLGVREKWKPVLGEVAEIQNYYNETVMELKHKSTHQRLTVRFRIYDDGVGFRYEFPLPDKAPPMGITITDEKTEFCLAQNMTAFWIPGDWDSNEHQYTTSMVSEIDTRPYEAAETSIATKTLHDAHAIQTPVALRAGTGEQLHMAIHEAALVDFPAMELLTDVAGLKFTAMLTPSPDPKVKAKIMTPFKTPWRAILLASNAAGLLNSKLVLNLNEPCKLPDVSWIKPTKYVGIWWEMHLGKSGWNFANSIAEADQNKPNGKHGATTENTKRYIDFAAANGFDAVLIEGWNVGWEEWFGKMKDSVFSFTTPYPDYDVAALSQYAKSKGVKIICHHETSAAVSNYESQMDKAYAFCNQYGFPAIKTGYVGRIIPRGEYHDGQWMVNHYIRAAEKTAQYKIMMDAHEPVRPTGLHRTYPHWVANEAARGNEFNAWSRGNPPEHETILPFTRLLGGPMDYTPGIFDITFRKYKQENQVHTTVAKQLALYVTMYSPLQMAADLIENYEGKPEFQFIRDVAADWDDTRILQAEIGDQLAIARRAKGTQKWFIGAITDENARTMALKLDFLEAGKTYKATIYEDGEGADFEKNPFPVKIRTVNVDKNAVIELKLARSGGAAISIM